MAGKKRTRKRRRWKWKLEIWSEDLPWRCLERIHGHRKLRHGQICIKTPTGSGNEEAQVVSTALTGMDTQGSSRQRSMEQPGMSPYANVTYSETVRHLERIKQLQDSPERSLEMSSHPHSGRSMHIPAGTGEGGLNRHHPRRRRRASGPCEDAEGRSR